MCGTGKLDLEVLQKYTDYEDGITPQDPHVIHFWNVLKSFTDEQHADFLRFVYARSRLPASGLEMNFKIQVSRYYNLLTKIRAPLPNLSTTQTRICQPARLVSFPFNFPDTLPKKSRENIWPTPSSIALTWIMTTDYNLRRSALNLFIVN